MRNFILYSSSVKGSLFSCICIILYAVMCITAAAKTSYVHELAQLMQVQPDESYRISVEVVNKPSDRLMRIIKENNSPNVDLKLALTQIYNICVKGERFFMSMCPQQGEGECQNYFHDGTFFYMMDTGNSRIYFSDDLEGLIVNPTFAPYLGAILNDSFISVEGDSSHDSIIKFQEMMNSLSSDSHSIYKCVSDASLYSVGYNLQKADELGVDLVFELSREVFVREESSIVEIIVTVEKLKDELDESFFVPHQFGDKMLFYGEFDPLYVRDFLPPVDQIKKIIKSDVLRNEYSREARERPKVISNSRYRADDLCHTCN